MLSFLRPCRLLCVAGLLWLLPGASGDVVVEGAGSSIAYGVYSAATVAFGFTNPAVKVRYTGVGAGPSLTRLEKKAAPTDPQPINIDFGATETLPVATDYQAAPDLQLYPTMACGVVPVFNLGNVTDLVLSTSLLARIFRGNVTYWDDPEIQALNSNFPAWGLPPRQRIRAVIRSDKSGVTFIFKKGLASFDSVFNTTIGVDQNPTWGKLNATTKAGNQGITSFVLTTPYTLGYSMLGDALLAGVRMARLQKPSGLVVAPSVGSIGHAVLQLGLAFGNNGQDPSRMTADIQNAEGPYAWPIVSYTYLAMRKATLRDGATCDNVRGTMLFWDWFWNSNVAGQMVSDQAFCPLPAIIRDFVLQRFRRDIQCNGTVWQVVDPVVVNGTGPPVAAGLLQAFSYLYTLRNPDGMMSYTAYNSRSPPDAEAALGNYTFAVTTSPQQVKDGVSVLFAGAGIVAFSAINVTLDGPTLARILDGRITTWRDPQIVALNPGGPIDKSTGKLVADAPIALFQGPVASSQSLRAMLRAYLPDYNGSAIEISPFYASEDVLRSVVLGYQYGLSVTYLSGTFPPNILLVPFQRADGHVVQPTWQGVQACATPDVYDAATGMFRLTESAAVGCYPLSEPLFLNVRRSKCSVITDEVRTEAAGLVEWLLESEALDSALQSSTLAALYDVSPAVQRRVAEAVDVITCTPKPMAVEAKPLNIALIAGVAVGGGVLLMALVAGFWWHGQRNNRAAPKDSARPFCIAFTDIQASTHLWATVPAEMAHALEAHHTLIRKLICQKKMYEVKTIGDSFMVATADPRQAVAFALELQRTFHAYDWETCVLDEAYEEKVELDWGKKCHSLNEDELAAWNGLRVRVGIHYGQGDIKFDPVSKGYDYYGTVVNTAARIEAASHGGQVAVSDDVFRQLEGSSLVNSIAWTDLGTHSLRGLAEPVHLFQLLPTGPLACRRFPPLRLDVERADLSAPTPDVPSERGSVALTLCGTGMPDQFRPECHPLVLRGAVPAAELAKQYHAAMTTLSTLLATQTAQFKEATLKGLCDRLKVKHVGNSGLALQQTLHNLVMRVLPALLSSSEGDSDHERRGSLASNVKYGGGRYRKRSVRSKPSIAPAQLLDISDTESDHGHGRIP
eukprot:EG_transcript_913